MNDPEEMPVDPYTHNRLLQNMRGPSKPSNEYDKLRRFLEYDGKILKYASKILETSK